MLLRNISPDSKARVPAREAARPGSHPARGPRILYIYICVYIIINTYIYIHTLIYIYIYIYISYCPFPIALTIAPSRGEQLLFPSWGALVADAAAFSALEMRLRQDVQCLRSEFEASLAEKAERRMKAFSPRSCSQLFSPRRGSYQGPHN